MIEQSPDGITYITLGDGTLESGVAKTSDNDRPIGIYLQNRVGEDKQPTLIRMDSAEGIASYTMMLVRFLEETNKEDPSTAPLTEIREILHPFVERIRERAKEADNLAKNETNQPPADD